MTVSGDLPPDRATEAGDGSASRSEGHLLAAVGVMARPEGGRSAAALAARWSRPYGSARAGFQAALFRPGRLPVVLAADGLTGPSGRWEFRSSGLWVELVCEQPGVHWSSGLEAFALAVDSPGELLGRGYGDRVALGWELDVVARADELSGRVGLVDQPGHIEGLILSTPDPALGDDPSPEVPFEGYGHRTHWWADGPTADVDVLDRGVSAVPGVESMMDGAPLPPGGLGSPGEVAIPLETGSVWWLGHDGRRLTSRVEPGPG